MPALLHHVLNEGKRNYHTVFVANGLSPCQKKPMKLRLLQLRRDHDLTQAKVAEHLGISQALYAGLESGKRRMNATYMAGLAKLYGISEPDLYDRSDNRSAAFKRLEKAFNSLSEQEQNILATQAEALAAAHRED